MKNVLVFAVVCAIAFVGCFPMPSTESKLDSHVGITDDTVTDKGDKANEVPDTSVVTDEEENGEVVTGNEINADEHTSDSDELVVTDEEKNSEVNDEPTDNESVDEDVTIPKTIKVNVFLSNGGGLGNGYKTTVVFYANGTSANDLCIYYGVVTASASLGIDYTISTPPTCGPGTVKINAGATAVGLEITNINKTADDKEMVVAVKEGKGYELGENTEATIVLLKKKAEVVDVDAVVVDETPDADSVEINDNPDNPVVDETPDSDSVEEADEASDVDEISESDNDSVVESEDDVLANADVDETPDVDPAPIIIATNCGPSAQCKLFWTTLGPGTQLVLWDASGHRGPVITNENSETVVYQHVGWCAATSDKPMDAEGDYPYPWSARGVRCIAHNGDRC